MHKYLIHFLALKFSIIILLLWFKLYTNLTYTTWNNYSEISSEVVLEEKQQIEIKKEIEHKKTPEIVKSVYLNASSAGNEEKINKLIELIKKSEINSVTIDVKDVSWYVSFDMNHGEFWKIKPVANNKINNIESLIKKLHKNDIYVIWRIVVFKDNLLSVNRQDLVVKNIDNKKIWTDYKGNKYLDPYSKEVWDYNIDIASESYNIWFDEINFDYVRFPTDWNLRNAYFPFSHSIINSNYKWWKIIIIDEFSTYITSKLREKNEEIALSADIFWLVTNTDWYTIGQNLESFLLNFDYVWPMVYSSHYAEGYLWYSVPDNHAYEIITDWIKNVKTRINKLNDQILTGSWYKIKQSFVPKIELENFEKIEYSKLRVWLQWFACTRCKWATYYNREKFRKQVDAIKDSWLNSWWVWNSAGNYDDDWYDEN